MSTAAQYHAAAPAPAANGSPEQALTATDWTLTAPGWPHVAALVAVAAACLVILPGPDNALQDVVRLERLAPEIERARGLSADAREAISRVTTRTTLAGFSDPSQEARRKAAIERITGAMKAKDVTVQADDHSAPELAQQ
jgi:hypothetical protein